MDRVAALELFIRVVETGSFTRAAADSGITQPTATKAVAAMERRLGARLLHRTTRGVSPTEIGTLYYERCKAIAQQIDEADDLAALSQGAVGGLLRVNSSVAFGRRVLVPLVLRYMREHPGARLDLGFDDRYVNLVEQGVDVAVRMGRLVDSTLGARFLASSPWVMVASPGYLKAHRAPRRPADLRAHPCLIYSTAQGDERWSLAPAGGEPVAVPVAGPLRSNNLSALLSAAREGLGVAILPWYVARDSVADGSLRALMTDHALAAQEVHAVYPSPRLVPRKATVFIDFLQRHLPAALARPDAGAEGAAAGPPRRRSSR